MADCYFGVYGGIVTANDTGEGVLSVKVRAVFPAGEEVEARPCLPYGVLFLPEVGDKVWVQFEGGEPTLALWTGVQQTGAAWPDAPGPPTARVLRSHADHRLVLDDDTPAVELTHAGATHSVRMTDDEVSVRHDAGHTLSLGKDEVRLAFSSGPSVVLEQGKLTLTLGGSTLTMDNSSISLNGTQVSIGGGLVKLGKGSMPVARAGDQGVGNLGAPVVLLPGQTTVLA